MSAQFYQNVGRLARISLSRARVNNSFSGNSLLKQQQIVLTQPCSNISTSKKNRETIAANVTPTTTDKVATETAPKKKFWVSQGYSHKSEEEDLLIRNRLMFWSVTWGFVLLSYILMYSPDSRYKEWAVREAYIELARREALGLPLIDADLVPRENINLPTEEELGDFEIII